MKGVIFTQFFQMIEDRFGIKVAANLVQEVSLPSHCVYTSVGTYDSSEMVSLVHQLSKMTNISVSELLEVYGEYLFGRFAIIYPHFFTNINNAFDMLANVDTCIHVDVLKLYPDAELPKFICHIIDPNTMKLHYSSERAMPDLVIGLIKGCAKYYNENVTISREDLSNGQGKQVLFTIGRIA